MKKGIVKYQSEIGLSDDELAEILTFLENYVEVHEATNIEDAEMSGVYTSLKDYGLDLLKEIYSCRKVLRGLSAGEAEEVRIYIRERFDLDKKVPTRRAEYVSMAENILEGHSAQPVEQPDFVVPNAPFDRLQAALDKLRPALENISRERAESRSKTAELNRLRKKGERILRNVYLRAIAHWGVEDKRLLELGMMYKRGIWTSKKKGNSEGNGVEE
ncbi:MAG TPA: hypothetical protein ENN75_03130 [candidate division Zixibacteria bacterium]|nr:hypothetical protein [candidate division Zixibacteria bacterium]